MRKAIVVILDLLFVPLFFCDVLAPEWFGDMSWLWIAISFLGIHTVLVFWPMFFKRPFIAIENDWVVLDGMRFERDNILSGRVFSARVNGEMQRYLEVAFKTNPPLPLWFRVIRFFVSPGYPRRCAQGIPLAKSPRVIIPMGHTPLSDERIHQALSGCEQAMTSSRP